MAVSFSPLLAVTTVETLGTGVDGIDNPVVSHNGFNLSGTILDANSTPVADMASYQTYALVAAAKTVDLRALEGVQNVSQDANGKKLHFLIIRNPTGNNTLTATEGAANGYPIFGAGNSVEIPAGATLIFYVPESLADVAATDKDIDFAGTGTESFDVGIVLG